MDRTNHSTASYNTAWINKTNQYSTINVILIIYDEQYNKEENSRASENERCFKLSVSAT
jgi:hypothetical protein